MRWMGGSGGEEEGPRSPVVHHQQSTGGSDRQSYIVICQPSVRTDVPGAPHLPREMVLRYTDVPEGRIRTRVLGQRRGHVPPVVVVQGMTVSDYLLPACAELGAWTEAHLLDLPGYAGSGEPTRRLDVRGYGEAVADWL